MGIGPRDFDPFRAQIKDCACDHCWKVAGALSDVTDYSGRKHRAACEDLLTALRNGSHVHMTYAARGEVAKAETEHRVEAAIAAGKSQQYINTLRRGYATVKMSDFYATGMGLGMTPRL